MYFVKRLTNYIKYVPNNLPLWQSVTKPQQNHNKTNNYERSLKSLNS